MRGVELVYDFRDIFPMKRSRSEFDCYCGFMNTIVFNVPTVSNKAWLEHDCLSCGARYDIRIYPEPGNKHKVKLFKRLIIMSPEVLSAIKASSEKSAELNKENGVLSGEEARKRDRTKGTRASKSFKTY